MTTTTNYKNYIDAMQKKAKEGITASELREYFEFLCNNEEGTKTVIMDKLNNSETHKRKRKATKETLCNEIYDRMITDLVYCVQDTFSMILDFSGNHKQKEREAVKKVVYNATDEQIQAHLEKKKARNEECQKRYDQTLQAIRNPK